jgi:hypothetical protein
VKCSQQCLSCGSQRRLHERGASRPRPLGNASMFASKRFLSLHPAKLCAAAVKNYTARQRCSDEQHETIIGSFVAEDAQCRYSRPCKPHQHAGPGNIGKHMCHAIGLAFACQLDDKVTLTLFTHVLACVYVYHTSVAHASWYSKVSLGYYINHMLFDIPRADNGKRLTSNKHMLRSQHVPNRHRVLTL